MKKILFALLAAFCLASGYAQDIVVGDMNGDQELTVGDVADLVSTINGKQAVRRISLLTADNSAIVGSWQSAQGGITFNADGTTDYTGAERYKFYPSQGRIVLFGTGSQVVAVLDLIDMEENTMVLSPRGTTTYTTYYKGSAVNGITISQTTIHGELGQTYQLTASLTPPDAAITAISWESSNTSVATVDETGLVTIVGGGTATITASASDGSGVVATCEVTVPKSHEYVDLGLPSGIKWATCNVGADNPEDYGDYYAWGETETKSTYNWSTYKWCSNGSWTGMTKYTYPDGQTSGIWYNNGTFVGDNKTTLDPEDDVAHVKWGGDWRMPTKAEQDELRDTNNCTWTWTTQGGKNGYKVTSKKNGNSIFLPASGYRDGSSLIGAGSWGNYWSGSLLSSYSDDAYYLEFSSRNRNVGSGNDNRYCGFTVRPVCP